MTVISNPCVWASYAAIRPLGPAPMMSRFPGVAMIHLSFGYRRSTPFDPLIVSSTTARMISTSAILPLPV